MSERRNKKYDTQDFGSDVNKEELFDIYKSFEAEDFSDTGDKKKKDKKSKDKKKSISFKTDEGFKTSNADADQYSQTVEQKELQNFDKAFSSKDFSGKQDGFVTDEDFFEKKFDEGNLTHFQTNYDTVEEQDESAPRTIVVTKESPAIKIYAILAVAVCFLFIGGLVYKSISDEDVPVLENSSGNTTNVSSQQEVASEVTSEIEYIDYEAQMAEIEEPTELKVVNDIYPLTRKDVPSLVRVSGMPVVSSTQIEKSTHKALSIMYKSMKQDGVSEGLRVFSGYRSYSYQNTKYKAFEKYMKNDMSVKDEDARVGLATQLLGKAGTSEHQLGTSIDLCVGKELDQGFLSTSAGQWLLENAHKYGFVFRYTSDKADFHKRTVEPWHLRYVGVTAATKMYAENLCLEEYLGLV